MPVTFSLECLVKCETCAEQIYLKPVSDFNQVAEVGKKEKWLITLNNKAICPKCLRNCETVQAVIEEDSLQFELPLERKDRIPF